jgi:ribonuclease P protein component
VFQAGRKRSSCYFALHFRKNNLPYARLGVVVAKRNVRKATVRNVIKRIIRESFRLNSVRQKSYDVVVVIYKPYSLLSKKEMRHAIDEKWKTFHA